MVLCFMLAVLTIATLCTAAAAAPRPLNDAERAIVKAFSVFNGEDGYGAEVMFSETIDDGVFVFSDERLAELGYTPRTKITGPSRISYSWYRGQGDFGRGVGIVDEGGAWIAEASAGTESASIVFLRDGHRIGGMDVPPIVVDEMEEQDLFDQLEATRAGASEPFDGVTFLIAPEDGHEASDEWMALGEPEKILPAAREDRGGERIRFVSSRNAVVELRNEKSDTVIFSETITAGRVYEFAAPIMPTAEESEYIIIFRSSEDDESTVEWYLQEEGFTGRQHRQVWRLDYAAG